VTQYRHGQPVTVDYVLCCTRHQAYHTALRVWGWEATPEPMGVRSPDGNPVKLVSSARALASIPVESTLYLAQRWQFAYEEPDGHRVEAVIAAHEARGGKVVRTVPPKVVDT